MNKDFPQVSAVDERGFSQWFTCRRFWAECCDCALVHELQFKIDETGQPAFRVRRANGYTRRQRKARGFIK